MKNKIISILLLLAIVLSFSLTSCKKDDTDKDKGPDLPEFVDYVDQLKLDMNSETAKQEVTVKYYIDGDTTHFNVPTSIAPTGLLKARYLAINTPESTGTIEQYGKKASNFTKETLKKAVSIIIESDRPNWEYDSTGERHLVWVWYKTSESGDYRNLNLEILQNGLALSSTTDSTRYGEVCVKALTQAEQYKMNMYSGVNDPDFYFGSAIPVTLAQLRTNPEAYKDKRVAFEGVVTALDGQSIYVEAPSAEPGVNCGMYIYYGFNFNGIGLKKLTAIGNKIRVVGNLQFYENGNSWQLSDLKYYATKPNHEDNVITLEENVGVAYPVISYEKWVSKIEVSYESEEEIVKKTLNFAELAINSSICMENLVIDRITTTKNEDSKNYGAMTLTCHVQGNTSQKVKVRTTVLLDENREMYTASDLPIGSVITVKGIIDCYDMDGVGGKDGEYQIKVFAFSDIIFVD